MVICNVTFITMLVKCDIVLGQKAQSCHLYLKEATAYIWVAKLIKDYGLSWIESSEKVYEPMIIIYTIGCKTNDQKHKSS